MPEARGRFCRSRCCTASSPATARPGESLYAFLPRTIAGGVVSAWRIEARRLAKRGAPTLAASNRMLRYAAAQVAIYALIGAGYGLAGVLFFAAQSALAFVLVEIVNYVELDPRLATANRATPRTP